VNGQNSYCHIVCNPLYTAYFTTESKDRLTILDVLTNHRPRRFLVNAEAVGFLEACGLSAIRRQQVPSSPARRSSMPWRSRACWTSTLHRLGTATTEMDHGCHSRGAPITAELEYPWCACWSGDDAPQFTLVTDELALLAGCNEGRHYKKLVPMSPIIGALGGLRAGFWMYYANCWPIRRCRPGGGCPTDRKFATLFATVTGYAALTSGLPRRVPSKAACDGAHPPRDSPPQQPAELGARARVRKRDVSFGPRTREGATAWTLYDFGGDGDQTRISFYHYIS